MFTNNIFGIISGGKRKEGTYGYAATRITAPAIHEYIGKAINRTFEEVINRRKEQLLYIQKYLRTSGDSDEWSIGQFFVRNLNYSNFWLQAII